MDKIIVIIGATATNKTLLAKKIVENFNGEIINADSFQVYKELNIGINKPNQKDIKKYNMHLFNEVSIYEEFDVAVFQSKCSEKIKDILHRQKVPILCGGSNLYIDAIIKGYDLKKTGSRQEITFFDNWEYDKIYEYVLEKDYDEAIKIGKNNRKRIIRAAQIIHTLNCKKSLLDVNKNSYIYDCLIIETCLDRQVLYKKINKRVDEMISCGWMDEVKNLYENDSNVEKLQAFNAIGYKEILNAIRNNSEIDHELIKQKTRNYAKKQLTWNRNKYDKKIEFNVESDSLNELFNLIKNFLLN